MAVLYAVGAVWGIGAVIVLVVSLIVHPPCRTAECDMHLRVALGWPWYLARAVRGFAVSRDFEDER